VPSRRQDHVGSTLNVTARGIAARGQPASGWTERDPNRARWRCGRSTRRRRRAAEHEEHEERLNGDRRQARLHRSGLVRPACVVYLYM
jgi:hypothetical protein